MNPRKSLDVKGYPCSKPIMGPAKEYVKSETDPIVYPFVSNDLIKT
jgi:hypothetical protein